MKLLEEKGITDKSVLEAVGKVPRHLFLNSAFEEQAYEDRPFAIGAGQTISQPYTVAVQKRITQGKKGYEGFRDWNGLRVPSSSLTCYGNKGVHHRAHKELYDKTSKLLPKLGYRVKCFYGDGNLEFLPGLHTMESLSLQALQLSQKAY